MKKHIRIISFFLILCLCFSIFIACDEVTNEDESNGNNSNTVKCEDGTHVDVDDNGSCDICEISLFVYIDFYAINDLHGKFCDTSSNNGVDELTTYLKNTSLTDEHTVFLSSGDMWQGSSESNLTNGKIITEWMNELGFASMTLGNHEFDWGEEAIEENAQIAEFPILAINIFDRDTNTRGDYCESSVVIEFDGFEVGIIGAIGDCYSSISGDKTGEIYFKTGNELTALVKAEAQKLRSEGVDFIIYSLHDGFGQNKYSETKVTSKQISSYYDSSLSDGFVDLVFEGHTHQRYVLVDEYGVYHLQNGGENKGISHVEIKLNSVTLSSDINQAEFVEANSYSYLNGDPLRDNLLEKYKDAISKADEVLGTLNTSKRSDVIEQMVAELYYKKAVDTWGDEYDIVLGGGFIRTRSPYDLSAGTVKYSHIQSVLPFDNPLVLCSIKGSDLINKFFETNNSDYFIYYEDYGASVYENIDYDATYYVVVDSYTSTYAYNRLTEIDRLDDNIFARDLLAEFIKNGGWQ